MRPEKFCFLHEHGVPWDVSGAHDACTVAASCGHLDCLRFLHEQGCPWDADHILWDAIRNDHRACVRYLHEHGCTYIKQHRAYMVKHVWMPKWRSVLLLRRFAFHWVEVVAKAQEERRIERARLGEVDDPWA